MYQTFMIPFADGFSLEALQATIRAYGAFAPFMLGVFEEVFFFIPSPLMFLAMGIVLIPAGVSWSTALTFSFGQIAVPATFGVVLGAGLMYAFAYFGGKPAILSFGRYFGVTWGDTEKMGRFFGRGYADGVVLVSLRAIPIFPISVVSIFCGLIRIRPAVFFVTTFFGSFIRIGTLSFAGWYAGHRYALIAGQIASLEKIGAIAVFALLVFLYLRFRSRSAVTAPKSE